jgi:hypothetical protein
MIHSIIAFESLSRLWPSKSLWQGNVRNRRLCRLRQNINENVGNDRNHQRKYMPAKPEGYLYSAME